MKQIHLEAISKSNHDIIVARVRQALVELQASNKRISFYAVAKTAQVARSTLYRCADLRLLVETARTNHTSAPSFIDASNDMANAQLESAELARMLAKERERTSRLERELQNLQSIRYSVIDWKDVA